MTISSTTRKAGPFTGDGIVVTFPFAFKVFSAADLLVVQTTAGVDTPKALVSDYSVTLNADQNVSPGGTVTMSVSPPVGSTLTLTSQVANTQNTDLSNLGGFYPKVITDALDRATIQIQQLADKLVRSLSFPVSDTSSSVLPGTSARAGKLLAFDAAGLPLATTYTSDQLANAVAAAYLGGAATTLDAVAFLQAGTGAVSRSSQTKARERVSVFDYFTAAQVADVQARTAALDVTTPITTALNAAVAGGWVLVFPSGFYKADVNLDNTYDNLRCHFEEGAEFGGIWHLISSGVPVVTVITAIARSANVVAVTAAGHSFASGKRVAIKNVTGGTTDFNGDDNTITVIDANTFTYPQVGANEAGTVAGQSVVLEKPLKGLRFTGTLTTYDRLGTINAKDCYIQRVHIKSDGTKHTTFAGTKSRGVHIYFGTDDFRCDEMIVDDCGVVNNTDAAVSCDGSGLNPMRLAIGRIWVKASDAHAVYLTGGEHRIGEIRVDEFVAGTLANTQQDSDSNAQSIEGKGVWINRCWDSDIGHIRVNQSNFGTRSYAKYHLLVDETGVSSFPGSRERGLRIGKVTVRNAKRFSVSFVDQTYAAPEVDAHVGLMEIQGAVGNVVDRELLSVASATSAGRVAIDVLRFIDSAGFNCLKVYTGNTRFLSNLVEALAFNGQLAVINATSYIGKIRGTWSGGSSAAIAVDIRSHTDGWYGDIELTAAGVVTTPAVRVNNCIRAKVVKIFTSGFRHATSTVELSTLSYSSVDGLNLTGGSVTGVGLLVNDIVNCALKNGLITDFAKGSTKGAGVITRCSADNLICNSNTTATDIPAASFASATNCTGFTL